MTQATIVSLDLKSEPKLNALEWNTLYRIVETDDGLAISESRVLLFDVMEAYDEGDSNYQICENFNLTPLQVKTAIKYIEQHRAKLEPEFVKAVQRRNEREAYYRKLAEERWEKIEQQPVTPLKAAVRAKFDKIRAERANGVTDADHSQ